MILEDVTSTIKNVTLAATSFIIGLSWNNAIRSSLEESGENKFVTAILTTVLTLMVVFVIALISSQLKPHIKKIIPIEWFDV